MNSQKFQENTFDTETLKMIRGITRELHGNDENNSQIGENIEFIRAYISKILAESGKNTFRQEDIGKLEDYINELKTYQDCLKGETSRTFSFYFVEKFRFESSIEEFKTFFQIYPDISKYFMHYKEEYLLKMIFLSKNRDDFYEIFSNLMWRNFFDNIEQEKCLLISHLFYTEEQKEFFKFLENYKVRGFLEETPFNILEKLGKLGLTKESLKSITHNDELLDLCSRQYLHNFCNFLLSMSQDIDDFLQLKNINFGNMDNFFESGGLQRIFQICNIKNNTDIILLSKTRIFHELYGISEEKLLWFLDNFPINSREKFLEFFKNSSFTSLPLKILEFLFSLYGIGIKEKILHLSNHEDIKTFLNRVRTETFLHFLERFRINSPKEFEDFLSQTEILTFLKNTYISAFKKLVEFFDIQDYNQFKNLFAGNQDIIELFSGHEQKIKNIFFLLDFYDITQKEDLEKVASSQKSCAFIERLSSEKFQLICTQHIGKNIDIFITFCENIDHTATLSYIDIHLLKEIILRYSKNDFIKVIESRYIPKKNADISNLPSTVLFECIDFEIKGNDALRFFRQKSNKVLSEKERNKENYRGKKVNLSIYVRLGHRVDYPEIADALIIFAQFYIGLGYSSIFQNIRIIPRKQDKKPSKELFTQRKGLAYTEFFEVSGDDFLIPLHEESLSIFLSHSTNSKGSKKFPSIISQGMQRDLKDGDIPCRIELEKKYMDTDFTEQAGIEEIFDEFFGCLRALEKSYQEYQNEGFHS